MQAAQRKTEYQPSPPRRRVVKIEGNVAYISTGRQKSDASRAYDAAAARNKSAGRAKAAIRPAKTGVRPRVSARPAVKAKKRAHKGIASTMIVIFVAFCALALLVSRYAAVCIIDSENNKLKSDIISIEARAEELKADMELQSDLEHVRNTAVNKLGMTYPEQNQKFSLDMS